MIKRTSMIRCGLVVVCCLVAVHTAVAAGPVVCDRVRFLAAPDGEAELVGGRFEGSNASRTAGFQLLGEIKSPPPAGRWGELEFVDARPYRWIRYVVPAGTNGRIAEIELYAGAKKLVAVGYGEIVDNASFGPQRAWDRNPKQFFRATGGADVYTGGDLRETNTAIHPTFSPEPGSFDGPLEVAMQSTTPGAVIRYTLDGTMPTAEHGETYTQPIRVERSTTFQAIAFLEGRGPSFPTAGSYLLKADRRPGLKSFHIGNSLTYTSWQFPLHAASASRPHEYRLFTRGGAFTKELWDVGLTEEKERWDGLWNSLDRVDHLTLQPRDFDVAEEAAYERKFIELFRTKSPDVQPWLHCEWADKRRTRPTDRAEVPSRQMQKLFPTLSWEESSGALILYAEEVRDTVAETMTEGKKPRVLPSVLIMGWVKNLIDAGKIPGVEPGSFYRTFFNDQVHPSYTPLTNEHGNGGYLVDLLWYGAFYGESPEGRVLPLGTTFSPEQAQVFQRLAWDIVENYPDCGVFREGTEPVGKPEFNVGETSQMKAGDKMEDVTKVTLQSTTPGAWFRYTLDGTEPTRTRGYIYCGVISVRPGMRVRAVSYRNGMADGEVSESTPFTAVVQ